MNYLKTHGHRFHLIKFVGMALALACFGLNHASQAATAPAFEWVRAGVSTNAPGYPPVLPPPRGIAVDASSNSVVVGEFYGPTFTLGALVVTNSGTAGETYDGYVAKLDAAGTPVWLKRIGGTSTADQYPRRVAVDASGNIYVIGGFVGSTTVGATTLSASGSQDVMVIKFDASGTPVWFKKFGGNMDDTANAITVDSAGNVFIAGRFQNTINLGGTVHVSTGDSDVFVAKLDSTGAVVWGRKLGGTLFDSADGIALDGAGNVVVLGNYTGSITVGAATLNSGSQMSSFVARFDSAGTLLWGNGATCTDSSFFTDLKVGADGGIYFCGRFGGTLTAGTTVLTSPGAFASDAFVGRMDANGNWVWAVRGGLGTGYDYANQLAFAPDNSLVVVGYYTGNGVFGSTTLAPYGQSDAFVAGMSTAGAWLWAVRAGGGLADAIDAVATDPAGNIYAAGTFQATAAFSALSLTQVGQTGSAFVGRLVFPVLPAMLNPVRQADGTFTFTITGPAGRDLSVSISSDLRTAFGAPTVIPNPTGTLNYQDTGAIGQTTRFYRVSITTP